MFDIVSRLSSSDLPYASGSAVRDPASASLYDQILQSVLQSLHIPEAAAEPVAVAAPDVAPSPGNRTLEDILTQRRVTLALHDSSQALPLEQIALYQQSLDSHTSHAMLREELAPWELLMGQLTFQQRLAS